MSFECSAALEVAALRHARVESKICDQLFAVTEPAHIAHRRHHSVKSDEINAAQTPQAQQRFLGRDFLRHVTAQQKMVFYLPSRNRGVILERSYSSAVTVIGQLIAPSRIFLQ
jgi:hypothetical protein